MRWLAFFIVIIYGSQAYAQYAPSQFDHSEEKYYMLQRAFDSSHLEDIRDTLDNMRQSMKTTFNNNMDT